mgnify:CR=1 FL=1|tara:strand:- start:282 stop:650 length:369 start_codon:yes stop_codon:yes gene_type:complete
MDTTTKNELIKNTLQDLSLEYLQEDATEFLNCSDELDDYDTHQIFDELQDNGFFNVDIIYYSKAIKYLQENDSSLCESLEIASDFGYTTENINSELLASLHASRDRENKFWEDVEPKLNEIL